MAHLVSPRQDVALRRPGWSRSVYGLPAGRHHRGAFLWWLSLCKQRKLLARIKHALCEVAPWKRAKQCHCTWTVGGLFRPS